MILEAVDILLVAGAVYALIRAFSREESRPVLVGLVLLVPLFVLARAFSLRLLSSLFELVFPVLLVVLVILFQEDLRRMLERVGARSLRRRRGESSSEIPREHDALVRTLPELARARIGALVVLEGREPLARHLTGGERLDGVLSAPLLTSIFDPHSAGHDGALLVSGGRARLFSVHLPLSDDLEELSGRGTRHAAALGISERTDALALVVSEERGTISAAEAGKLRPVADGAALAEVLDGFARRTGRTGAAGAVRGVFRRHLPAKALALVASVLLWFFAVHEATVEYRAFEVPIRATGVAEGARATLAGPSTPARLIVSGTRRAFYFVEEGDFAITAKLFGLPPGEREVTLTASDVTLPAGIEFVNVVPRTVTFRIAPR